MPISQPPNNPALERAVLGDVMVDQAVYWQIAELVKPDTFYIERHRWVWEALTALIENGEAVGPVSVCTVLDNAGRLEEVGGAGYIADVMLQASPTTEHTRTHARQLADLAERRRLITAAAALVQGAYGVETPEELLARIDTLSQTRKRDDGVPLSALVGGLYDRIEHWTNNPLRDGEVRGLPTGIACLDRLMGGMEPALYILAGRPSMGKTAVAMQIAAHVASNDGRVLVWNYEMGGQQLVARMACTRSRVEWRKVKRGTIDQDEMFRLVQAQGDMNNWPMTIFSSEMTPHGIKAAITRELYHDDVALVVIDSLNLMSGATRESNRNYELGSISRDLLLMASELEVPIIAVHHLNRSLENRNNKRPLLSDLRDSGEIEQNADAVIMLYRPAYYYLSARERSDHSRLYQDWGVYIDTDNGDLDKIIEIIVRKDRLGGQTGTALAFWNGDHLRVEELARQREAQGGMEF